MKKIVYLSLLVLPLLFISFTAKAQSIKLGPGGGLTLVQSPEELTKDISEDGAGFGSEFHVGLKAKVSFPLLPLTLTGQFYYHLMGASDNFSIASLGNVDAETDLKYWVIGVGGEWTLLPGPISPYIGFDFFNTSSGDFKISVSTPAGSQEQTAEGDARWGIGVGAGVEFTLLPTIDVDVVAKYNFNNLLGKEDGEEAFNTITLSANFLFSVL